MLLAHFARVGRGAKAKEALGTSDNANSEQPLSDASHYVWQYLLLQTITILTKAGPRMLSVLFVTQVSVDSARAELHIS